MDVIAIVSRTSTEAVLIRSLSRSPKNVTNPSSDRHSISTNRAAKNSSVAHSMWCMYFSNEFDSSARMISNNAPNNATQAYDK